MGRAQTGSGATVAKGPRPKNTPPTTTPERNEKLRRGEGREALCRALVRVAATKGLDGVTFRSVAAEAGVTHGLASYHFANRESMISEALVWAAGRAVAEVEIAGSVDNPDEFAAYLSRLAADTRDEAAFQFLLAIEALRRPDLLVQVRAVYRRYFEATSSYLTRYDHLADDPDIARLVFAAMDGLVLQQLIFGETDATDRALQRLHELLAGATQSGPNSQRRFKPSG